MKKLTVIITICLVNIICYSDIIDTTNILKKPDSIIKINTTIFKELAINNDTIYIPANESNTISESSNNKQEHWGYRFLPLLIVMIAAIFALIQVKMNNVTNARIRWIENLRAIISSYLSEVENINLLLNNCIDEVSDLKGNVDKDIIQHTIDQYYNKMLPHIQDSKKLIYTIDLHLNSIEPIHSGLILNLKRFNKKAQNTSSYKDLEALEKISEEILRDTKLIFKEEWEKVKRSWFSFLCYKFIKWIKCKYNENKENSN